ncbi:hypothetical protein SRO_5521 [Streptomyces rochei]|nr:hypothetical protein SRO_5521 [Streptomyces rochei]
MPYDPHMRPAQMPFRAPRVNASHAAGAHARSPEPVAGGQLVAAPPGMTAPERQGRRSAHPALGRRPGPGLLYRRPGPRYTAATPAPTMRTKMVATSTKAEFAATLPPCTSLLAQCAAR